VSRATHCFESEKERVGRVGGGKVRREEMELHLRDLRESREETGDELRLGE
jgi:hypothetical protein